MKNMLKLFLLSLAVMIPVSGYSSDENLNANDANVTDVVGNIRKYFQEVQQERVYMHFDNTSYYKGDSIWFKAYVVGERSLDDTDLSKILYVELVNPQGVLVETQKLAIEGGQSDGCFALRDTINAGYYEVRAYTSWMLNFCKGDKHANPFFNLVEVKNWFGDRLQQYLYNNAGIYSRVFPVYDAQPDGNYQYKTMAQPPKTTSDLVAHDKKDELVIRFYPEGGNLVDGIPTRVAFEASNEFGKKINLIGDLYCGNEHKRVQTDYAGRGCFEITPCSGKSISFKAKYNGKDYSFELPKIQKRGYVLNVHNLNDSVRLSVRRNSETEGMAIGLAGYSRGSLLYGSNIDLSVDTLWTETVSNKDLKTGVNIFTLFTSDGSPMAQRLVFVDNHQIDTLFLTTEAISKNLQPYQKININFTLSSSSPKGEAEAGASTLTSSPKAKANEGATFSLSIADAEHTEQSLRNGNILTELLLSSEIKGFVPNPQYYFESNDPKHRKALDELLMVQGWTRYDWDEIAGKRAFIPRYNIEKGLTFSGQVLKCIEHDMAEYNMQNIKKPLWVNFEVATPKDGNIGVDVMTDSMGYFKIDVPLFTGNTRAFLYLNRDSRKELGDRSGLLGHVAKVGAYRDTTLEATHFIRPMNVFPPLGRPYDYYEIQQYQDELDNAFITDGIMYDRLSQSYVIGDIVKKGRRRWTSFDIEKPTFAIDVNEMTSYLSNVLGYIENFSYKDYNINAPHGRLFMSLLGLSGSPSVYVDAIEMYDAKRKNVFTDNSIRYVFSYGREENLPKNMKFFPRNENFRTLYVYADMSNRDLIYTVPKYKYDFLSGPMTIRANYTTDNLLPNGKKLPVPRFVKTVFNGIATPVDYYHPDYSKQSLPEHKDHRRTLYWNPNVKTDKDGKAKVEFYNNSSCKQVVISAEGITADGRAMVLELKD